MSDKRTMLSKLSAFFYDWRCWERNFFSWWNEKAISKFQKLSTAPQNAQTHNMFWTKNNVINKDKTRPDSAWKIACLLSRTMTVGVIQENEPHGRKHALIRELWKGNYLNMDLPYSAHFAHFRLSSFLLKPPGIVMILCHRLLPGQTSGSQVFRD